MSLTKVNAMKIVMASLIAASMAFILTSAAVSADDDHHAPAVIVGPGHGPSITVGPVGIGVRDGQHGGEHRSTVIEEHRVRSGHHGEHHDD